MDAIKEVFNDNIYIHPDILPEFNHKMVTNEILKENVDNLTKKKRSTNITVCIQRYVK